MIAGVGGDPFAPDTIALESAWADRVRGNRDQVDRLREVADPADFYAPVATLFRAEPDRTNDPVLDRLLELARPGERWLDIGAGAGRYALPLAQRVGDVVAIDPSAAMLGLLSEAMAELGAGRIQQVVGRWPDGLPSEGTPLTGDVALAAHVGYDIEAIGPFLEAMEAAASRLCVAVMMERSPATVADSYWPPIHGEARVALPALRELEGWLLSRGRLFEVALSARPPRIFEGRDAAHGFLRRQLWLRPDSEKDLRLRSLVEKLPIAPDGIVIDATPASIGVVSWATGTRG
jgi:SAM-dependent methyltransferase